MDRFAFKINKKLKLNLYKICRLCGIEYPDMVPILKNFTNDEVIDLDEVELSKKILDCIGLEISKDDKMPQTICSQCVEKIEDFYEFREMCYSTNDQTRKLLGLKDETPKKKLKAGIKTETLLNNSIEKLDKRGRKRKTDELLELPEIKQEIDDFSMGISRKRVRLGMGIPTDGWLKPKEEIKEEPKLQIAEILPPVLSKFKNLCNICTEGFSTKKKLEKHISTQHIPNIKRFHCAYCNETLKKTEDIRNHQLWHKLSKTPCLCPVCDMTLVTFNALTRHVKEHTKKLEALPTVLDRECPKCRVTFVTHFLYNTHPCAVKTHKCGGCNRLQRNDADYLKHSVLCAKAFLNPSNHISFATEADVRIKNENDVEAANEVFDYSGMLPLELMPVVTMTHPSDGAELEVDNNNKHSKKSNKTKQLKKRVNELLKSTRDTLVSIKQEPEIHVGAEAAAQQSTETGSGQNAAPDVATETEGQGSDYEANHFDDDHHGADDDSDDSDSADKTAAPQAVSQADGAAVVAIKQEKTVDGYETQNNGTGGGVRIKTEPKDANDVEASSKVPVLKLKIVKEHGTLNSSIVNDSANSNEKKKKKKKRKESEKRKEGDDSEKPQDSDNSAAPAINMPLPGVINIKQERMDDYELASGSAVIATATPTAMTTIPMMQLQIVGVSSGVSMDIPATRAEDNYANQEVEDIKPNPEELNRLLQITSVSGNIEAEKASTDEPSQENGQEENQMEEDHIEGDHAEDDQTEEDHPSEDHAEEESPTSKPKSKAKPCHIAKKRTGGNTKSKPAARHHSGQKFTNKSVDNEGTSLKIAAVASGVDASLVVIKAEPRDSGYEQFESMESEEVGETADANAFTEDDEQAYIRTIDFNNLTIKQEKDIEIVDTHLENDGYESGVNDESDHEEEEESEGHHSEGEHREYRELELPIEDDGKGEEEIQCKSPNKKNQPEESHLKITAVNSIEKEADSALFKVPSNPSPKKKDAHAKVTSPPKEVNDVRSIEGLIQQAAEHKANVNAGSEKHDAEGHSINRQDSSNETDVDEEQENVLNQRRALSESSNTQVEESSSSNPQTLDDLSLKKRSHLNAEETDNIRNESRYALTQQQRQHQNSDSPPGSGPNHSMMADHHIDSNINEIAENNNNANLERELQAEISIPTSSPDDVMANDAPGADDSSGNPCQQSNESSSNVNEESSEKAKSDDDVT